MTADMERRRRIVKAIDATVMKRTERDKQSSIGPSEIGDPCAHCVGKALCRKYPELWWEDKASLWEESFGLAAWVGTAIHDKMEREHPFGLKEETFAVWDLPDYGLISGHVDLVWESTVIDYKSAWKHDIREYKLSQPPVKLQFQPQMYGMGVENAGHTVKDVCLFFIPRDTNDYLNNRWPAFAPYNRKAAEVALKRLEKIWRVVQDGKGAILESYPKCYECADRFTIQRFTHDNYILEDT